MARFVFQKLANLRESEQDVPASPPRSWPVQPWNLWSTHSTSEAAAARLVISMRTSATKNKTNLRFSFLMPS